MGALVTDVNGVQGAHAYVRPTEGLYERYQRDGFVVLPQFASPDACDALRAEAERLVEDFDPATISIFSTLKQTVCSDSYANTCVR